MQTMTDQHNNVLLSINDLYTNCTLGNDYIDPIYTLDWIYDYYNPMNLINDIYNIPEDNYTHYTPHRYCYSIVCQAYSCHHFQPRHNMPRWQHKNKKIRDICYLTIQGIILREWQQNDYNNIHNICHKNLMRETQFKKNIDICMKQCDLQERLLEECLEQIRTS
jgi:hypothetical protein